MGIVKQDDGWLKWGHYCRYTNRTRRAAMTRGVSIARSGARRRGAAAVSQKECSALGGGAYAQLVEPISWLVDALNQDGEEPPRVSSSACGIITCASST